MIVVDCSTIDHSSLTYLHYLEGGGVEAVGLFHDHLPCLLKDVVPDVLLFGGKIVLDPSHVGPLALPRWHTQRTRCQVPTHSSVHTRKVTLILWSGEVYSISNVHVGIK